MKENNKRSLVLVIIAIATLILIVGAATFAFFATGRDLANGNLNASVGTAASMYSFSAESKDKIEIDLLFNEMSEANVSTNKIKTDNATIDVSLSSPSDDMLTTCTYDIVWIWDSTGDNIYTSPDMTLPSTIDNKTYNYEFSAQVDSNGEKDLSKYSTNGNVITLQEGITLKSNSTTPTTKTYKISASVYNLPVDQEKLFGKSFRAHITIDNLNCTMVDVSNTPYHEYCYDDSFGCELAKTYTTDGANGIYLHDGEGNYTNSDLEAGDNSYRYAGADPDNYVCFAGEDCSDEDNLYRIIGVIDNKVKLIKNTNINTSNTLAWDSNGVNTWEGSSLETYLNGEYLTKLGEKANLIEGTKWSAGGYNSSDESLRTAKKMFEVEMSSTPKTTKNQKIGLMYTHEYMYAAAPTYWNKIGYNSSDSSADYRASKGNDWMLDASKAQWTISRYSVNNNHAFRVWTDGAVGHNSVDLTDRGMRPTFSLKSTVKKLGGTGAKERPYVIYDGELTLASYIKHAVYSEDGVNGLYLHDGKGTYTNADLEAGDNSYRYAGANPNNYVCFQGDDCTNEDNLYRIIGVIDNKVKLIKYTNDGNRAWDSNGSNTWEGSSLETYLNEEYLTSLENKEILIESGTWSVGGFGDFDSNTLNSKNAKEIYEIEMASEPKTSKGQKIGLMYVHEYKYAESQEYWSATSNNGLGKNNNWLYYSQANWMISRDSDRKTLAFSSRNSGSVSCGGNVSDEFAVHPTFNLKSSAKITNANADGVGSKTTPMIIG